MTKITLPTNTVRPNGIFFTQAQEAVSLRNGSITYTDKDTVELELEDIKFFDINEFNKVLSNNGEVEYYPLKIAITKDKYNNEEVPQSILDTLGFIKEETIEFPVESPVVINEEEEGSLMPNISYDKRTITRDSKWKDIFTISLPLDADNIYIVLSYNSEFIKGSVAKLVEKELGNSLLVY